MIPKAILLDLDDTIIAFDHGIDLDGCWKKVCSNHLRLDDIQIANVITLIKKRAKWFWSDPERHRIGRLDLDRARIEIVTGALQEAELQQESMAELIAIDYGIMRDEAITLNPDAIETLKFFRENGIKLALITNGAVLSQRSKIERFGLAPLFDCIIIEEEFGAGKPSESVYLHALEQLAVKADEAWMIGDNFEWEVRAPQQLGIKGIWVNPKGLECPSSDSPFATIKGFSDIQVVLTSFIHG